MDPVIVETECWKKAESLLKEYFGELVHDAAVLRPETVDEKYFLGLPLKIENEFKQYLNKLWAETAPGDSRSLDDILNHPREHKRVQDSYSEDLPEAYDEAQRISMWEKITSSNHKDVTFFREEVRQLK